MADLIHDRRHGIAHIAFILLVVAIPVFAGMGWLEHQRNEDTRKLAKAARVHAIYDDWQLYDAQVAACERVNVIRGKQNAVIKALHENRLLAGVEAGPLVKCRVVISAPTEPRPKGESR